MRLSLDFLVRGIGGSAYIFKFLHLSCKKKAIIRKPMDMLGRIHNALERRKPSGQVSCPGIPVQPSFHDSRSMMKTDKRSEILLVIIPRFGNREVAGSWPADDDLKFTSFMSGLLLGV